ncbi:hypothetical protein CROQUDRAFT_145620 [Cronartium quercuum f. sp. fusiforme G11]|uniref:Uncharacterized protein n=1 Tax=Cronartium quercuum f. sp. fusiforme G11 TaxID=708437 RepID=A0A9P6NXY7_9BASI|nr:hypothetical protein CROQUDRAFT_145620 [Cronartium quercuum f. sp. fusiforme G11]
MSPNDLKARARGQTQAQIDVQLTSPAHTSPDTARKEEFLEVSHHHRLLSSLLTHPIHSYNLTPSSTLASPVNLRPLSADSSDSSPVSGDWTKADGCSSRSSVHEQEKQDDETMGLCEIGEVKEEEARVNRKILDLEISNASLLAINARLERTKLKQANEIRELRQKMRERSMGHHASTPVTLDDGSSAAEESETEEGEKIESLMKVDQRFAEAIGILEGLIGRAKQALVSVPGDLGSKKVLNRIEFRADGDDDEDDEEEEEDLEANVDISITSSHLPSSNPLPTPPPLSPFFN